MRKHLKNRLSDDYLEFGLSVFLAFFLLLICGSWFIGLLLESNDSPTFLFMVSFGGMLAGIGCFFNCIYLLTGKIYKKTFYLMVAVGLVGWILAFVGQIMYEAS